MPEEEGRACSEGFSVLRPIPSIVRVYSSKGEMLPVSEVLVISTCSECLYSQTLSRGSLLEILGRAASFTLALPDEC